MQRKYCRVFAVIVAGLILLTGCNSAKKSDPVQGSTTQATPAKAEKIKVIVGYHADQTKIPSGKDINNNDLADQIRKVTGVDVTFESLPKDDGDQKASMLLASGDAGDLLCISKDFYFKYAKQGVFSELDSMISKLAPDYVKQVPESTRNIAKVGGKVSALIFPATTKYDNGLTIRKDIFDKYSIKIPTTLDEFYTSLKDLKEKAKVIPFSSDKGGAFAPIRGAFGVPNRTVVKDGKLVFSCTQPEYKEYLTFMKKLYDEQLVDKEFSVNKVGSARDKLTAGSAAMSTLAWWDQKVVQEALDKKGESGKMVYIPLVKGKDGKSGISQPNVVGMVNVIPSTSKNKETAVKFFNALCGDEYAQLQTYGIENVTYTKSGSEIKFDAAKYNELIPYTAIYNNIFTSQKTYEARLVSRGFIPYHDPVKQTVTLALNYENYMPAIDEYVKVQTAINDFDEENMVKFILGSRPLSEFDKFVEEFNAKGGKTAQEAIDKWYQADGKSIKIN